MHPNARRVPTKTKLALLSPDGRSEGPTSPPPHPDPGRRSDDVDDDGDDAIRRKPPFLSIHLSISIPPRPPNPELYNRPPTPHIRTGQRRLILDPKKKKRKKKPLISEMKHAAPEEPKSYSSGRYSSPLPMPPVLGHLLGNIFRGVGGGNHCLQRNPGLVGWLVGCLGNP